MARLKISFANRLIPNRLKLNCNGLEVEKDKRDYSN